jgi:uncharacterized protein (UPF0218 family)
MTGGLRVIGEEDLQLLILVITGAAGVVACFGVINVILDVLPNLDHFLGWDNDPTPGGEDDW